MQKYIQHLNNLLTTAQSLIDSVTQSSETVQTRAQGPSTLPSQHSTRKHVHALSSGVDSSVYERTASTQRLMTTREQRRYDDPFMAFFVGIPPRDSFAVVRRRHSTTIVSSRRERHGKASSVRKETKHRNPHTAHGARLEWTVHTEEDMGQALADIDGWLKRIKDLAKEYKNSQCGTNPTRSSVVTQPPISTTSGGSGSTSNASSFIIGNTSPSRVREHGKILHSALTHALRGDMGLFLRLERNHMDPASFEQFASRSSYLENEGKTSKFLTLVSDRESLTPYPLLAHVYPNSLGQAIPELNTMDYQTISSRQTLHDILDGLEPNSSTGMSTPVAMYKNGKVIVLHRVRRNTTKLPQSPPCALSASIFDLAPQLHGNQLEILHSHKKRVSVATTMAHSVLQLQETGWLPQQLSLNDLFYHAGSGSIDAWLSPLKPGSCETTLFECIHDVVYSKQLTNERDRHLSATYHRLGIALLELGHGCSYQQILHSENDDNGNGQQCLHRLEDIHTAINTINLGRSYQDVVRLCLTGRLLQGREVGLDVDIDRVFGEMVLRK